MTQPHQSAVTSLPPRSQPSRDDAFPRQHAQVTRPESESQGNEAASGDKPTTTPLSVLTNLNCGRALYHKRDEEDSNSSLPPSSASISVPISAVRQTPTTRRLLSPNSVTARFSRPKHPYLTEDRRAISSTWTSPAIMTAVDRRPSLSATHSLEAGFQEDQAVATFPISPLVMSSPTSTGMRRERRKAAPSWPDSPRGPAGDRAARDAVGLDSPGYLQTPSILRNIPPPTATPTHSQFLHTPLTAGYKTPFFSSAPPLSNARGEPSASSSKQPLPARDRRRQEGIPKSYFVKSLHNLAPNFWNKPATADCRVLVPIRGPGQTTPSPTQYASFSDHPAQDVTLQRPPSSTPQLYGGVSPALVNAGAFASTQTEEAPESAAGTQTSRKLMTFNLHRDYLVSQSALFAELLDDRPPMQKASSSHQVPPPSAPSDITSFVRSEHAGRSSSPRRQIRPATAKGARILQTPAHVPTTIWLPLPDPGSFAVLAHVLYWGDASVLETALARGEVTWQGVVKNTEYLGFDNAIKRILGSWFRRWVKVSAGRTSSQGRAQSTTAIVQRRRSGNDCEMQSEDDADFFGPAVSMPLRRSENNATVLSPSGTGAQTPVMEGVDENADAEVVVNLMQGL